MGDGVPLPRWSAPGPVLDRVVVAGVVAVDLIAQLVVLAGGDVESPSFSPVAALVAVGAAVPLLWRRTAPLATLFGLAGAVALASAWAAPGLVTQQTGITIILSVYAIGSWSNKRWASVLVPLGLTVLLFLGAHDERPDAVEAGTVALAAVALPWTAGRAARSRRRYVQEVERRLVAAEAERDERARRAVLDERTHIARELHDVVAHHVSLIGVQAGAARAALDADPEATRTALLAIEEASRHAVGEMHTLLGVLRDDDPGSLAPQPGLGDLDRLANDFRAAGLDVMLVTPAGVALAPALGLTSYRIVEEALTNVTRHSQARAAEVTVEIDDEAVHLTVLDPGPHRVEGNPPGGGRGLLGLRERVALFGGRQRTGATPTGGFEVRVSLPRDVP